MGFISGLIVGAALSNDGVPNKEVISAYEAGTGSQIISCRLRIGFKKLSVGNCADGERHAYLQNDYICSEMRRRNLACNQWYIVKQTVIIDKEGEPLNIIIEMKRVQ